MALVFLEKAVKLCSQLETGVDFLKSLRVQTTSFDGCGLQMAADIVKGGYGKGSA